MESRLTHLGFLQGNIARMGGNSFQLKGWSVTLVAALFALSARDSDHRFVTVAWFPVFVFWLLDAFFLRQERLYRELYVRVASGRVNSDDLTLDVSSVDNAVDCLLQVAVSKTLICFYGSIVGVVLLASRVI